MLWRFSRWIAIPVIWRANGTEEFCAGSGSRSRQDADFDNILGYSASADTTPATALRMLVAAECRSGANPERLRNVLASDEGISGVAFLPTGEPRKQ